jgi:hypothetical protein
MRDRLVGDGLGEDHEESRVNSLGVEESQELLNISLSLKVKSLGIGLVG